MKICTICAEEKSLDDFYHRSYSKDGYTAQCKSCSDVKNKELAERRDPVSKKNYEQTYHKTPEAKFKYYQRSAKNRNLLFNLTFEEFKSFYQQPCFYCSESIESIGLDRINNKVGYEFGNVVSCCIICNKMKLTLGLEDFLTKCEQILKSFGRL